MSNLCSFILNISYENMQKYVLALYSLETRHFEDFKFEVEPVWTWKVLSIFHSYLGMIDHKYWKVGWPINWRWREFSMLPQTSKCSVKIVARIRIEMNWWRCHLSIMHKSLNACNLICCFSRTPRGEGGTSPNAIICSPVQYAINKKLDPIESKVL